MENIYQQKGFLNRRDYLEYVASIYCVDLTVVHVLAGLLGASEDFDGLLSSLSDETDLDFLDY